MPGGFAANFRRYLNERGIRPAVGRPLTPEQRAEVAAGLEPDRPAGILDPDRLEDNRAARQRRLAFLQAELRRPRAGDVGADDVGIAMAPPIPGAVERADNAQPRVDGAAAGGPDYHREDIAHHRDPDEHDAIGHGALGRRLQRRRERLNELDEVNRQRELDFGRLMNRLEEARAGIDAVQDAQAPAEPPRRRRYNQILEDLRAAGREANIEEPQPGPEARAARRLRPAFVPAVAALGAPMPNVHASPVRNNSQAILDNLQPLAPRQPILPPRAEPRRRVLFQGVDLNAEFPPLSPIRLAAANRPDAPRVVRKSSVPGAWVDEIEADNSLDWSDIEEDDED